MLYLAEKVGLKQKFRNWKSKKHYEHDAYRDVLTYDPDSKMFTLDRTTVKQRDIEPADKIVTNDTYHYFNTPIPPQPRIVRDKNGFTVCTPIDDYQYTQNNDIIESLLAIIKPGANKNTIILAILGGVGVAVVGYILMSVVF